MNLTNILVICGGISSIGFIYWFFFGDKNEIIAVGDDFTIIVDGGYIPSILKIKKDKKTTINFLRKDANSCLEEVIFPDFKIKEYLPLSQNVKVELTPNKKGEFEFHCGMNMFHGKIIVI